MITPEIYKLNIDQCKALEAEPLPHSVEVEHALRVRREFIARMLRNDPRDKDWYEKTLKRIREPLYNEGKGITAKEMDEADRRFLREYPNG